MFLFKIQNSNIAMFNSPSLYLIFLLVEDDIFIVIYQSIWLSIIRFDLPMFVFISFNVSRVVDHVILQIIFDCRHIIVCWLSTSGFVKILYHIVPQKYTKIKCFWGERCLRSDDYDIKLFTLNILFGRWEFWLTSSTYPFCGIALVGGGASMISGIT